MQNIQNQHEIFGCTYFPRRNTTKNSLKNMSNENNLFISILCQQQFFVNVNNVTLGIHKCTSFNATNESEKCGMIVNARSRKKSKDENRNIGECSFSSLGSFKSVEIYIFCETKEEEWNKTKYLVCKRTRAFSSFHFSFSSQFSLRLTWKGKRNSSE